MTDALYYRLCFGLNDIGTFHPISKSPYDIATDLDQEIFKSVYYYTAEQVKEAEKEVEVINKKTGVAYTRKRGIGRLTLTDGTRLDTIPGITDQLIFDLDSKDFEDVRADGKTLIEKLEAEGIPGESIKIAYSGGKGLHIKVDTEQYFTAPELRSICTCLMDGLSTCDTTVYNDARILRLTYSRHHSGLYTTPLFISELENFTEEEIKELAGDAFDPENEVDKIDLPEKILAYKDIAPEKTSKTSIRIVGDSLDAMKESILKLDFENKMPHMPAAKWVLQNGFIPSGYGQDSRMILASSYRTMGFDDKEAYYLLKSASKKRVALLGEDSAFDKEELWINVIGTVYSPLWQGGCYSVDHPLLAAIDEILPPYLKYKPINTPITTKDEAFRSFVNYSENIDKNTIHFGIKSLDKNLRIITKNVYGLLAPPSVGKTSVALQILENTSERNIHSKYFSFDMSGDDTIEKIMIRHTGKDGDVIMNEIKKGSTEDKIVYKKILDKYYNNVDFIFKPGMGIEEMERTIKNSDKESGKVTKLVVVDYLSLIRSGASDATSKTIEAIQGLRYLSHELNCVVFVLLQPNKMNSKANEPIKSYNGIKGSSEISEALTAILTAYREGFDPQSFQDDNYLSILCVKNRKGKLFSLDYHWEGKRGHIRELEDVERQHLKELRALKKLEKDEKAKW